MKRLFLLIIMIECWSCRSNGNEPEIICQGLGIVAGQNQILTPGKELPLPLKVQVTDESGMPISGAQLKWIANGGGFLNTTETTTDNYGASQVSWTPGFGTDQSVVVNVKNNNSSALNNCGWDVEFVGQ